MQAECENVDLSDLRMRCQSKYKMDVDPVKNSDYYDLPIRFVHRLDVIISGLNLECCMDC